MEYGGSPLVLSTIAPSGQRLYVVNRCARRKAVGLPADLLCCVNGPSAKEPRRLGIDCAREKPLARWSSLGYCSCPSFNEPPHPLPYRRALRGGLCAVRYRLQEAANPGLHHFQGPARGSGPEVDAG